LRSSASPANVRLCLNLGAESLLAIHERIARCDLVEDSTSIPDPVG